MEDEACVYSKCGSCKFKERVVSEMSNKIINLENYLNNLEHLQKKATQSFCKGKNSVKK